MLLLLLMLPGVMLLLLPGAVPGAAVLPAVLLLPLSFATSACKEAAAAGRRGWLG
jgi:hypothetical protein